MEKVCGIYKITSPTKRVYIGQSIDCKRRKGSYKRGSLAGQSRLLNSVKKYGWERHKFEVIHQCDPSELDRLEIYYISLFHCFNSKYGLNLQSGGSNPKEISHETRDRLRVSQTGKKLSEETKEKIRQSKLGSRLSEDHKRKIGDAGKGRVFSEASRIKKSQSLKGWVITPEHREKISKTLTGRIDPDETRKNKSEAAKLRHTARKAQASFTKN